MAVIFAPQGEIQILMKWNGAKFDQQMLGVPDGNVQVSEPAPKASGRFGDTVMRDGEECIRVYSAEQFLNAIGSYRHILVAKYGNQPFAAAQRPKSVPYALHDVDARRHGRH